jgi:hypothetical protein
MAICTRIRDEPLRKDVVNAMRILGPDGCSDSLEQLCP